jgi:ABC-type uncharacterized transport system substrate-binding protein
MRRMALPAAALLALLPTSGADAHPHVLIDVQTVVEFRQGMIVSLLMGWKFDPVYSASLMKDFDANKDGRLDAKEMAKIEKEAFQDTRPQSYFTYPKVDGKPVTGLAATDFKVMGVKDSLLYAFRLPLPQPVDPRKTSFSFSTYEETYYIDIDFPTDNAVVVNGEGSAGCRATIAPDRANALLGGVVIPKKAEIVCD